VHGELKRQSEDKTNVSLKSDWPQGIIFGRPHFMKIYFEEADKKLAESLTGQPQLPDPSAPDAHMPEFYEQQFRQLQEEKERNADQELDFRILQAIKDRYDAPKQDFSVLKQRQDTVNSHYRQYRN